MRRTAVLLVATSLLVGLAPAAGGAVAARCRLVATTNGPELKIVYRLWDGGARDDWRVKLFRDDDLVYQRISTTDRDGRFRVVRVFENEPGRETIVGTARRLDTGAVCAVSVRV